MDAMAFGVASASKIADSLRSVIICSLAIVAAGSPILGDVRMQVRDGLPVVDGVYVNGHGPHRFLVDTGTNVNLIEADLAKSIGLNATFRSELATSMGVTILPGSDGIHLKLDSAIAEEQRFLFLRLEAIHQRWPDIEGVLGQWFLSRFDYVLDLRGKRLEFRKQDRTGTRAQFRMHNGRPVVSTSLGDLVLDSGSVRLVLFGIEPDARQDDPHELKTFTGSRTIGTVFRKPLIIEGRRIWRGQAVAVPHSEESGVGGLLPLCLFKAIYVCNSEGYIVFE
jgi:hypothetical protein